MIVELGVAAGIVSLVLARKKVKPVKIPREIPKADPIPFKEGEPRTFKQFTAQEMIVGLLEDAVGALSTGEVAIKPQMFAGTAGGGKTLLAKIVAQTLRTRNGMTRFLEAMDVTTEAGLDRLFREIIKNPGCVVFFDEIHSMASRPHLIKMYLALDEGRYHFDGDLAPTALPPVTFIAATTDYGALPDAFKRRWVIHFLVPYTRDQLMDILKKRNVPATVTALEKIIDRTWFSGAPWECIQLLDLADNARKARKDIMVGLEDVDRVIRLHQIDEQGLRSVDRAVIQGLFTLIKTKKDGETHFAGSEETVALMGKVDKAEFKATIRPRLLSRGLLELRPWWGHTLTDKAVELYGHLNPNREPNEND